MSATADKLNSIPEKGAVVQRDRQTFAIAPHIPGGLCDVATLRKIADVAEKYNTQAIKITSAQRIALIGIQPDDIDAAWADLQMVPGAAIGMCVRSIKFCPGVSFCRLGKQDSVNLGQELDRRYHGVELPMKFKIGVAGCANSCAESWVKDLGFIGLPKGWRIVVGGNAGARPAIAHELITVESTEQALEVAERVIEFCKRHKRASRLGRIIENIGIDEFRKQVGCDRD